MMSGESVSVAAKTGMMVTIETKLSPKVKKAKSIVFTNTLCLKYLATCSGTPSSGWICKKSEIAALILFNMAHTQALNYILQTGFRWLFSSNMRFNP